MPTYQFETNLELGQETESVPAIVDPLRLALNLMTGGASLGDPAAAIDLDPLTFNGGSGGGLVSGLVGTGGGLGTYQFAYGSGNRIPTNGDEFMWSHLFGMEIQEFISWWYTGTVGAGAAMVDNVGASMGFGPSEDSGEGLYAKMILDLATDDSNMVVYPINVAQGESGGWYKEAVTMKKLRDGVYSDGSPINIRLADEAVPAHVKAFPNVGTPGSTPGVSFLGDVFSGKYNAGEFSNPLGDSSTANGMFPNYPNGAGGIIDAGLKHYYIGSWHTPFRGRILMVNKNFHDTVLTLAQRTMLRAACYQSHMQNIAYQGQGQDLIIKKFQELGATIHESLPRDVLLALRGGVDEEYTEENGGKGTEYTVPRDHQRLHMRANQVRWRSGSVDRRFRFQSRRHYEADLQPNG